MSLFFNRFSHVLLYVLRWFQVVSRHDNSSASFWCETEELLYSTLIHIFHIAMLLTVYFVIITSDCNESVICSWSLFCKAHGTSLVEPFRGTRYTIVTITRRWNPSIFASQHYPCCAYETPLMEPIVEPFKSFKYAKKYQKKSYQGSM